MKRPASTDSDMTRLTPTAMARLVLSWIEHLADPLDFEHWDLELTDSEITEALIYGRD